MSILRIRPRFLDISKLRYPVTIFVLCHLPICVEVKPGYNTVQSGIQERGPRSVSRDVFDVQLAWENKRGAPQYSVNKTFFNPAVSLSYASILACPD